MNPGFLSLILISISLILLASGWKRTLLGNVPHVAIVLFFTSWCISGLFHVRLRDGTVIGGTAVVLAVVVALVLLGHRSLLGALHYVSLGLFLASVYYLMKHLGQLDPFFLPSRSWAGPAIVVALLAAALIRRTKDQIACLSLALLSGYALYWFVHRERVAVPLGDLRFQDEWWLAAVVARLCSSAGQYAAATLRTASRSLLERWKGLRK